MDNKNMSLLVNYVNVKLVLTLYLFMFKKYLIQQR